MDDDGSGKYQHWHYGSRPYDEHEYDIHYRQAHRDVQRDMQPGAQDDEDAVSSGSSPILSSPSPGGPSSSSGPAPKKGTKKGTKKKSRKGAGDKSYAKLIQQCLLEAPNYTCRLKDIQKWFEEYHPAKIATHGWENSIRHNLSQNRAFCNISKQGKARGLGIWQLDEQFRDAQILPTSRGRKMSARSVSLEPPLAFAAAHRRSVSSSAPIYGIPHIPHTLDTRATSVAHRSRSRSHVSNDDPAESNVQAALQNYRMSLPSAAHYRTPYQPHNTGDYDPQTAAAVATAAATGGHASYWPPPPGMTPYPYQHSQHPHPQQQWAPVPPPQDAYVAAAPSRGGFSTSSTSNTSADSTPMLSRDSELSSPRSASVLPSSAADYQSSGIIYSEAHGNVFSEAYQ